MCAEKIFAALKDEGWHSIDALSQQTEIEADKLAEYSQFLNDKGLIEYDFQNQKIKIEPEWNRSLPDDTQLLEPNDILANFSMPGKTSVVVQSTRISNLTGFELDVTLRINGKIRELAINL